VGSGGEWWASEASGGFGEASVVQRGESGCRSRLVGGGVDRWVLEASGGWLS